MALDVAIDIGTSRTRLATSAGVIVDELTVVAIDTKAGEVVAIGEDAYDLVARTARHIVAYRPFSQGTTIDFDVTARLISGLFERGGVSKMSRARVVMSVPTLATEIERRALRQAAVQAGAKEVTLIEAPIAAAIGVGLDIAEPVGSAIAIVGGGASEVAVISLGGIVTSGAKRIGGTDMDTALSAIVRNELGVVISPRDVDWLKAVLGSAVGRDVTEPQSVRARTVSRGETVTFRVDSHVVHRAISDPLSQIIAMMQSCLGDTPPDLAHDVARLGITIAGGGALLQDLAPVVAESLGVEVHIAPDPDRAVINGLRYCLDDMGALHAVLRPLR